MDLINPDKWDSLMSKLQLSTEEEDLDGFFFKTKLLLERKSRLFWHNRFFERYIEHNINPWGLRVQIFPNIRETSPEFKSKWEGIRIKCSEGLMELLREHHLVELSDTNKELDELEKRSSKLKVLEGFSLRNDALGTHMEGFHKRLIQSKNKKFDKNVRAFK